MNPKAKQALDTVVEKFQTGDLSQIVRVAMMDIPEDWPAAKWSIGNKVLAFAQSETLNVRGYKQWQKAGFQVQKNHGSDVYIWAPRMTKIGTNDDGDPQYALTGFNTIPLFSQKTTDFEGDEASEFTPQELPELFEVAAKLNVEVIYTPTSPDRRGDYSPGQKRIRLGTQDVKTFFHELAHAAHDHIDGLAGSDAFAEVVAEFTAAVLMELYGYGDRTGNAWQYIKGYHNNPVVAITKAMKTIEQVLDLLTSL